MDGFGRGMREAKDGNIGGPEMVRVKAVAAPLGVSGLTFCRDAVTHSFQRWHQELEDPV